MNDWKSYVLTVATSLSTFWLAFSFSRYWAEKKMKTKYPKVDWLTLPSGWSKQSGRLTGCVMQTGEVYHWWITRNGRTIIEGPASTITLAKSEVEQALSEFQP